MCLGICDDVKYFIVLMMEKKTAYYSMLYVAWASQTCTITCMYYLVEPCELDYVEGKNYTQ